MVSICIATPSGFGWPGNRALAQIPVGVLDLQILENAIDTILAADPAFLEAPHWNTRLANLVRVHPDRSRLDGTHSAHRSPIAFGPNTQGEAEHSIVRHGHEIVLVLELHYDAYGAENLLLRNRAVRIRYFEKSGCYV